MECPTGSEGGDAVTADDVTRAIETTAATEREHALALMQSIMLLNRELSPLVAAKQRAVNELKQRMLLNREETIYDHERGIVAYIQRRAGTPVYDLLRACEAEPGVVTSAGLAGVLRLDHQLFSRFRARSGSRWADHLASYEMPGQGTDALLVEPMK